MLMPFQVIQVILATNTGPAARKWQLPMRLLQMVVPITNQNMSVESSLVMEPQKNLIPKEPAQ